MKRNLIRIGLVSLFVAVVGVFSVQAQMSHSYRADIPFDFHANGTEFKAGSYSVGMLGNGTNSGPLIIQNRTGKGQRLLSVGSDGSTSKTNEGKLVFAKIGGSYVLKEVLTPTFGSKVKIRSTATDERLAIAKAKTATVTLAKE